MEGMWQRELSTEHATSAPVTITSDKTNWVWSSDKCRIRAATNICNAPKLCQLHSTFTFYLCISLFFSFLNNLYYFVYNNALILFSEWKNIRSSSSGLRSGQFDNILLDTGWQGGAEHRLAVKSQYFVLIWHLCSLYCLRDELVTTAHCPWPLTVQGSQWATDGMVTPHPSKWRTPRSCPKFIMI